MKINTKILQTIGVVVLSSSLIAGGLIFFAKTTKAQENLPAFQYDIVEQSSAPLLVPNQAGWLTVTLRNTGGAEWPIYQMYLTSIFFEGTAGRQSSFATTDWVDKTTILLSDPENKQIIKPQGMATFTIPLQAPAKSALYQEGFQLYIGDQSAKGETIKWIVQVGSQLSYQSAEGKQIQIWLDEQRLWAIENNVVILDTPISSGKPGYATPKGNFKILNHMNVAYSSEYHLWMDNWMALYNRQRGFIGYGLHALPYWKTRQTKYASGTIVDGRLYQNGKVYEDVKHLGETMSHGCVRLGIDVSKMLYDWAPNDTPVTISA